MLNNFHHHHYNHWQATQYHRPPHGSSPTHRIAERIRLHVAGSPFRVLGGQELLTVTISIGVAASLGADDGPDALVKRADEAMYEAKARGRNRVVAKAA